MDVAPIHIIAVVGIVAADERILLVKTERADWEPPGGQVELGEDLITALQREIDEEAGVRAEVGKLVSVSSNVQAKHEKVVFTFLCTPLDMEVHPGAEVQDAGWFSSEEALQMVTVPAQQARLRDALARDGTVTYRIYRTRPYEVLSERRL
ncbi:MAG: NUDIX domain-containing protein [Armatimonadetes bacterium]|nr:NUDIX domain-containing protein [Armatimonadota bacterium]